MSVMRLPLVSVIVRSMARPTLTAALASIAEQEYRPIELIVVAASGASHPPVDGPILENAPPRLVLPRAPLSRAAAANAGLDAASGAWISFLDDDDVFLPGHLGGLVGATRDSAEAQVFHAYGKALFQNGHVERFGQPHALIELFDRNYLSLSTSLFARSLAREKCRFDEALEVLEDWDFFIQLAQHTRFEFVPTETFEWRADVGTSGAGGGRNQDDGRFAQNRDRVYAKWAIPRDALIDQVRDLLEVAQRHAARGDWIEAERACNDVLAISQNDPWALNLLAMIHRTAGELAAAQATQELAVAVRPNDPVLVHNLALVLVARRDFGAAQMCVERALALDPSFAPAMQLLAKLRSLETT